MSERDPYRHPVWIVLPGTRRYPDEQAHRVDPLAADLTMCGRPTRIGTIVKPPMRAAKCNRCNWRVYRRREVKRENRAREERMAAVRPSDQSIRTVSGGLPGLGKR